MTQQHDNTAWTLCQALIIPGDPVGKGRPRFNRRTGRIYTPAKTVEYERRIAWLCPLRPLAGPVKVEILAVFTRPKRLNRKADPLGLLPYEGAIDLDNVIKAANDGLQGRAFNNDRQVVDITGRARYAEKSGKARTEITIYALNQPTNHPQQETNNNDDPADMAPSAAGPGDSRSN
jgi:Holliday junction resolvase RusA-like endonuclease